MSSAVIRFHLRWIFLAIVVTSTLSCSDRKRTNPLDPKNPETRGRPSGFEAIAGDRRVTLRWDYSSFTDVVGYNLYRWEKGDGLRKLSESPLSPDVTSFVDRDVKNGSTYFYQISVIAEDAGESRRSEEEAATPGSEVCWVADAATWQVVKINPDCRHILLRAKGFFEPIALSVDRSDGSCWVADFSDGRIFKLSTEGKVEFEIDRIAHPFDVAVDSKERLCWVASWDEMEVLWFPLSGSELPLRAVDANFNQLSALSPLGGWCWISDWSAGRVLRYPAGEGQAVSFVGLSSPKSLAVDEGSGDCWVVEEGKSRISKLSSESGSVLFSVEEIRGADEIDVNGTTGECWIAAGGYVYKLDSFGEIKLSLDGFKGATDVSVNDLDGSCWVIGRNRVWKISPQGQILTSLGGFGNLKDVAVDPGR